MRPEYIPQLAAYPNVRNFVDAHLAMQFADVRAMLRLPLPCSGIDHGCNFAATAILTNLISGISVVLYNCQRQNAPAPGHGRGQRYQELLRGYYPWTPAEAPRVDQKIDTLWRLVRNPFAHTGAVLHPGDVPVRCLKGSLSTTEIEQLDIAYDGGNMLDPALELVNNLWDLKVAFFYAAVLRMFARLASDPQQMQRTEARFAQGQFTDGVL